MRSVLSILSATIALSFATALISGCHPDETSAPPTTTVGPKLMLTYPAAGATSVPVNALVSFTLNKELSEPSVTKTSFALVETSSGAAVAAEASASPAGASLSPRLLKPLTTYTATVGRSIQDVDGLNISQPYAWTFTTGSSETHAVPSALVKAPLPDTVTTAIVSVAFDQDLDPASISPSSFVVTDSLTNSAVPGTLSYEHRMAVFTPQAIFTDLGSYTVTMTTDVRSSAHANLAAPISWAFRTRGATFSAAGYLNPQIGTASTAVPAYTPTLGIDEQGNMLMLYVTPPETTGSQIYSRRYNALTQQWSNDHNVSSFAGFSWSNQETAKLLVDRLGNGVAVWLGKGEKLYTSTYSVANNTWSAPVFLDSNISLYPRLSGDAAGNAVVAWVSQLPLSPPNPAPDAQRYNLSLKFYNASTQLWDATSLTLNANPVKAGTDMDVNVAMHPDGDALVTYMSGKQAFSRLYSHVSGSWGAPLVLATFPNSTVMLNRANDYAGNEVCGFWVADNTTTPFNHFYVSRYDHLSGAWSPIELVYESHDYSSIIAHARLALDPIGNIRTLFNTFIGAENHYVFLTRDYSAATSAWLDVQHGLDVNGTDGSYGDAGFGVDGRGNALVAQPLWQKGVYLSQRSAMEQAWSEPVAVEPLSAQEISYNIQIAENRSGQAGFVYSLYDSATTQKYYARGFFLK